MKQVFSKYISNGRQSENIFAFLIHVHDGKCLFTYLSAFKNSEDFHGNFLVTFVIFTVQIFQKSRRVVFLCIFWLTWYIFDPLSTERFNFQLSNKYIFKINFISKTRHSLQNEMRSAGRMLWRYLLNGLILFYSHISHKYANYSPGTK